MIRVQASERKAEEVRKGGMEPGFLGPVACFYTNLWQVIKVLEEKSAQQT